MAGITNAIADSTNPNQTVDQATKTLSMLDEAKNQVHGIGQDQLKALFDYDKALGERYSSPDSKMYLENAGDREQAISGYSDITRKSIGSVFDIMETVRKASDDLKKLIDKANKSGSGSGSGGSFSLNDLLSWMNTNNTPDPPAALLDKYNKETGILVYKKLADGTYDWQFKKPEEGVLPDYEVWRPSPDKESILTETFGLTKSQLSELSAIQTMFGEKKANSLLWSYMQSLFTTENKNKVDTTSEALAQIKSFKTREEAKADLEANKDYLDSKGVDTDRVLREIDIYFDKQEENSGSAASTQNFLDQLKTAKGK